jgi:hypothetical protein
MRVVLLACLAAASVPTAGAYALGRSHAQSGVVPLALGDIARVNGTALGCAARLRSGYRQLDCRRFNPLVGTYGAILTMQGLKVVRYDTASTGTVVFTARHAQRKARACG